jgi:hypothetical protein
MCYWINQIKIALRPSEGLHCFSLLAHLYLKTVWYLKTVRQVMTVEKTQRALRASSLVVLALAAIAWGNLDR